MRSSLDQRKVLTSSVEESRFVSLSTFQLSSNCAVTSVLVVNGLGHNASYFSSLVLHL